MDDAGDETGKVLAERQRKVLEKKLEIARQIAAHLGPHASTADQSYVSRLPALAAEGKKKVKKAGKGGKKRKGQANQEDDTADMEVSQTNNQQPPAPPGAGAAGATNSKVKDRSKTG